MIFCDSNSIDRFSPNKSPLTGLNLKVLTDIPLIIIELLFSFSVVPDSSIRWRRCWCIGWYHYLHEWPRTMSDMEQHSQFLRCFLLYLENKRLIENWIQALFHSARSEILLMFVLFLVHLCLCCFDDSMKTLSLQKIESWNKVFTSLFFCVQSKL